MNERDCVNCGSAVPAGSNFCPKCGTELPDLLETIPAYVPPPAAAVAPATPPPAPPRRRNLALAVPIAIMILGLAIWALLAGLPFGDRLERRETTFDTISEGDAPSGSNNRELVMEGEDRPTIQPPTITAPPTTSAPITTTTPPPETSTATEQPAGEISQDEAVSTLRTYIASRDDFGVTSDCASVSPVEYRNAGYTLDAADSCDNRPLGRWRVDAKTREVFRQSDDGRYLRP